jgi:hypothetical protein
LEVDFNPDRGLIKDAIDDAITKGITVVCNNDLLLNAPEFERYMQPLEEFDDRTYEEETDILQMAMNDEQFKDVNELIKDGVNIAFS